VLKAFASLDPADREHLDDELVALATSHDHATIGGLHIPSGYLEVVAVRSQYHQATQPNPTSSTPIRG
jgi:hypothetical protein